MGNKYRSKIILLLLIFSLFNRSWAQNNPVSTLEQVLASKQDLWGIEAMRQPNGPSYEFFAGLLPPLRYVNAKFRHYPIVLCAPGSPKKARLVSNGSAINALPEIGSWYKIGTPTLFFVGAKQEQFGEKMSALEGPDCERGYLPIVQLDYRSGDATYREETFASVDWTDHAVLFTRFNLKDGKSGSITARFESNVLLHDIGNTICDSLGRMVVSFDQAWKWNAEQKTLTAQLSSGGKATLAIATVPILYSAPAHVVSASDFDTQKKKCVTTWEGILCNAMRVEVPEPIVNAAWKSTIIGSFQILNGKHMNYSSGNMYETMFEAECGDNVRALLLWGLRAESQAMIPPLLAYDGKNVGQRYPFHDASFKLQLLAHYYWLTRDATFVREQKPQWSNCVETLTQERDSATGLLPLEAYCGDEWEKVYSLNCDANAWRGLRDMAVVLEQIGEGEEARRIRNTADKLRKAVLSAVDKSEDLSVQPPFMPISLLGKEKPYDILTSTRRGSYWNLIIPYVIGSGLFNGTERETSMLRYLEEHGGISMGMIRFHQHSGLFANDEGLDDCFGLRYTDALLRRDEPERAIVSFYGKLAQGMTRGTFLSAEGTGLRPFDEFGRPMYLPPTSTGPAFFLWMLRSMLVQDYDLDNNSEPETLRLLFATPRRWLENGKTISVMDAPTSFGKVSIRVDSKLTKGEVIAKVTLPEKNAAKKTFLRIRLPEGWKINSAQVGTQRLKVDAVGTVDISCISGTKKIQFKVSQIS